MFVCRAERTPRQVSATHIIQLFVVPLLLLRAFEGKGIDAGTGARIQYFHLACPDITTSRLVGLVHSCSLTRIDSRCSNINCNSNTLTSFLSRTGTLNYSTDTMATTASPLTPTVVAGPSGTSPPSSRDPQRTSRSAQPRPTTYSGVPPPGTTNSPGYQSSPSPVTIPPRTSSQRQGPGMSTNSEPRAERSRSASERATERRSDRPRDREQDVESGRTKRATSTTTAAPPDSPQRRNSTSQRDDNRKTTNGASSQNQANGARSEGHSSRGNGASRSAPEGERRDARGRKETRFGDYILGQTLGEGEFGKVKLGWRRDRGVQVINAYYTHLNSYSTNIISRLPLNSSAETPYNPTLAGFQKYTEKSQF